jgi:predicted nucleic acid-binding protein
MIVLDASSAVDLVLGLGAHERLRSRAAPPETLHAPHLIDLEVISAMRRRVLRKELTAERAREAIEDFNDLVLTRYPHTTLRERIWALRHNVSAFDAAYVALAESLDAPLITSDGRLADVPGARARVEVLR